MRQPRQASVFFILVTIFLDILGIGLIIPVLPALVGEFTVGDTQTAYLYGVLVSVYALMQFLFAPVFGALSDRFGRRPIVLSSLLGYGLGRLSLWGSVSTNPLVVASIGTFMSFFLFYSRSDLHTVFRSLVWYALIPVGLVGLYRLLLATRQPRPAQLRTPS